MEFIKNDGGRKKYFPSKLKKDEAGDCVIRAIATTLKLDYMKVWNDLFKIGTEIGQLPNFPKTYDLYLLQHGWIKHSPMKNQKNRKFKVCDAPFNSNERYIVNTTNHVTAIINGKMHDTWNCSEWCANSYYTKNK